MTVRKLVVSLLVLAAGFFALFYPMVLQWPWLEATERRHGTRHAAMS